MRKILLAIIVILITGCSTKENITAPILSDSCSATEVFLMPAIDGRDDGYKELTNSTYSIILDGQYMGDWKINRDQLLNKSYNSTIMLSPGTQLDMLISANESVYPLEYHYKVPNEPVGIIMPKLYVPRPSDFMYNTCSSLGLVDDCVFNNEPDGRYDFELSIEKRKESRFDLLSCSYPYNIVNFEAFDVRGQLREVFNPRAKYYQNMQLDQFQIIYQNYENDIEHSQIWIEFKTDTSPQANYNITCEIMDSVPKIENNKIVYYYADIQRNDIGLPNIPFTIQVRKKS